MSSKQIKTRRVGRAPNPTSRELFLAALGAMSLTHKATLAGVEQAGNLGKQFQAQAGEAIDDALNAVNQGLADARERVQAARERIEALAAEALKEGEDLARRIRSQAEQGLQPLLVKVGLAKPAPARKPAAHKTARRPAPRRRAAKAA